MNRRLSRSLAPIALALPMLAAPPDAQSGMVTFHLDVPYNVPDEPPAGTAPWLRATFTDVAGGVHLTLTSLLQSDTEFVTRWYFNLDPDLDPTQLVFDHLSGVAATTVHTGVNAFNAPGDGRFDIRFDFQSGPPSARFRMGDTTTYFITSSEAISAASFNFFSVLGPGGQPAFLSAAHVQGISGQYGAHIGAVPEPSSVALLALGLVGTLGMIGWSHRRRSSA